VSAECGWIQEVSMACASGGEDRSGRRSEQCESIVGDEAGRYYYRNVTASPSLNPIGEI